MAKITAWDWQKAIRKAIEWENKYALLDKIDVEEEVPEEPVVEAIEDIEVEEPEGPQINKCSGNSSSSSILSKINTYFPSFQ